MTTKERLHPVPFLRTFAVGCFPGQELDFAPFIPDRRIGLSVLSIR